MYPQYRNVEYIMDTKIQKWGNSLALRIPKAYAEQIGLYTNSPVRLVLDGERLVIEPVRRATLDDLLDGITPENMHNETDWGGPVGNEAW
jgi:antitoxin MazE